ncbi:MAG: Fe-S cluster assembly protein SufD [Chitinivibrionales bacterium]|nr:Fe-S cluster assembly protein SufD [Chitinivibrionales bacterium]
MSAKEHTVNDAQRALFSSFTQNVAEPEWMQRFRLDAWDRFQEVSWPSLRDEEFRRTDLTRFEYDVFEPIVTGYSPVFAIAPQNGVTVKTFRDAIVENENELQPLLSASLAVADNRIALWHYLYVNDGIFIDIPDGLVATNPISVELSAAGEHRLATPHIFVRVGKESRASVVVKIANSHAEKLVLNSYAHIMVEDAAKLKYVTCQSLKEGAAYFSHAEARVARDAAIEHMDVNLGADLTKSRLICDLNGPGSEGVLNGVFFASQKQHMDIRCVQEHNSRAASSNAVYKGAVKDNSRSIFQGLIRVDKGANQTDAYLTNKNLIINDGARADSIPGLQIDTNDVKCSHGSTTGKISEDELFYLMSRGISRAQARHMLVMGFFEEHLQKLPEEVAVEIRESLQERLAGE